MEEGSALCDIIANSSTTSTPSPYEISNARKQNDGCCSSSSGCCGISNSRRIRGSMIGTKLSLHLMKFVRSKIFFISNCSIERKFIQVRKY